MDSAPESIPVECYAGYAAEETPRRFCVDGKWIGVAAVLTRWRTPEEDGFRVLGENGRDYFLIHSRYGCWRLGAKRF